jgi:transposase
MNRDIEKELKRLYPDKWKEMFMFSIFRFLYTSPIKNLQTHYSSSFISETIPNARLSPKNMGNILREIGMNREKIKIFLRQFISGNEFLLIDLTHVFSLSDSVISSVCGYNSKREFLPQIHMIFLFSTDQQMPSYFRIVPGSIRDVSSLVLTVKEAGIKNVVVIGDKGFYSEDNILELDEKKLHYVFPLKRDSSLIDYSTIQKGDKKAFDGHFLFENRLIWYYSYCLKEGKLNGKRIVVFLDEKLKTEEERDYISRIEEKNSGNIKTFFEIQHRQGTIAVITDLEEDGGDIYGFLKTRMEIEVMIDTFKNVLNADRTYMRDDDQMEGWMFINFISLIFYYRIYRLLVDNELLKKYSPKDVILHLSRIYKLKIQDQWETSEIPKKSRQIIEKLNLPIT